MQNRRKYDLYDTRELLSKHIEEDLESFAMVGKRLIRIELAIYAAAACLALFLYLVQNPNIIHNLTINAKAEDVK